MITHSSNFTALASAPIKQSDVIVALQYQDTTGYHDNTYSILRSSGNLMSVDIDAVGGFLNAATKKATVKLIGIASTIATGQIYQVRVGLKAPTDTTYEYVSEGFFTVDKIAYDYDKGSTTVTMYDAMWTAGNTDYASNFAYPTTVANLASQVASALGVTLDPNFSTLPNNTYTIAQDLYATIANSTLLTVIQEIAAATGTSARMSDTTLTFAPYSVVNERLDSSLLKNLSIGDFYGPITTVVLGRTPQNDNIVNSNKVSTSPTITNIDPTTELLTIANSGLVNGTLVQIASTGTMPGGVNTYTNYYVYTNGSTSTFQIMNNYADAMAGANPVQITSAGTGTIYLTAIPNVEIQINNNQILDNDRQTLLLPIYAKLLGAGWYAGTAKTIGLPWHEVGDAILFVNGDRIVPVLLSEVHLKFAGSIQEDLVSVIPDDQAINYQTAGGILKTLYNTEIKVDKQNNAITSVVSQQTTDRTNTSKQFTQVQQTIDGVRTQVQSVGGGNNILNSVGYAKETDGSLSFWTKSGTGTVSAYSSAGSLSSGALSGNAIQLTGATGTKIVQRIYVANTSQYSFGFRVNKTLGNGSASVTLSNNVTSFTIPIVNTTAYTWTELKTENIVPGQNYWDITVQVTSATTSIELTDLRVMNGNVLVAWSQSNSEILNTQVALTNQGIRVSSNVYNGDYTTMTPLEFAGYSNVSGTTKKVFWVNRDTTQVANLYVEGSVNFGNVIRAIPINSGSIAGLAFVGAVS